MALTATYDPVLSRIRLSATLLGAAATRCVFWRTTNNFAQYVTVRGGFPVAVTAQNAHVDDYEFEPGVPLLYRVQSYNATDLVAIATYDVTITQDLDAVWLKVPAAPFLNQEVTPSIKVGITRRSRGGLFDIVGRTNPVAVGDIRSSKAFTLALRTETGSEERDLDYLFASGEVVFLQTPSAVDQFPGGYYAAGDVEWGPPPEKERRIFPARRYWSVPLTGVAAPGPDVIGSAYTIASMLAEYATITAVISGNATIADLLNRTGAPSDVIVP